jgi:hypothetical protein
VTVSDLRIPFHFAGSPGGYGRAVVRNASTRLGSGRAVGHLVAEWGFETRVNGSARFANVPLAAISSSLGNSSFFGSGRLTGDLDISGRNVRSVNDLDGRLVAVLNQATPREIPLLQQAVPVLNPLGLVKPFDSGDIRATLSRGVVRVERLALANPAAQIFGTGTVTTGGLVNLDVVAHTGTIGPDSRALGLFGAGLPVVGPIPIGLISDVTAFLSNRTLRFTITGTTANPVVRLKVGALLADEAVRFFLSRYVAPTTAALALGLGAEFGWINGNNNK